MYPPCTQCDCLDDGSRRSPRGQGNGAKRFLLGYTTSPSVVVHDGQSVRRNDHARNTVVHLRRRVVVADANVVDESLGRSGFDSTPKIAYACIDVVLQLRQFTLGDETHSADVSTLKPDHILSPQRLETLGAEVPLTVSRFTAHRRPRPTQGARTVAPPLQSTIARTRPPSSPSTR